MEGTVAQTVQTGDLRQARDIGKKKLPLQALLTAPAVHVLRVCAWMAGEIPASTPVSRFARLMALVKAEAAASLNRGIRQHSQKGVLPGSFPTVVILLFLAPRLAEVPPVYSGALPFASHPDTSLWCLEVR